MTIHWKALETRFLMVPLVFQSNLLLGNNPFSEFCSKTSVLKEFYPEISDFQRTNSEFAKSEQKYPVKITLEYAH
jgi:hypothetical protein